MPSEYAYPGDKWEPIEELEAVQLSGLHLDEVIRFRASIDSTVHDVVVTGRLAEVHHDRASTTLLIDKSDAGDKAEYTMPSNHPIALMGKAL